ncbi:hypothetical protein PIB30_047665 [Stylosanthes scabra]|uniref:Uncharacterized protein n=1 Tax=Stylosanthes scabra TaxID=79078 RepID=A0ABU6WJJ5_9FABA|nr:hypothetical protein [Stylosanthes scabra]
MQIITWLTEIPAEAFQRVAETPQATQVDDVLDNRRQDRRRMVGTRTTAMDWQWLDQMMGEEEVAAPRRVRRMPEGGGRRGGRGGGRSRGWASAAQGQHGASTSGAHQAGPSHAGPSQAGASQDSWISPTPQHHFDSSTPRHLQQIFTGDTVYRPEFDGSTRMSQMDLNEPASAPSQIFMAHAGTLPSAYMPDPYVIVSDPAAALQPQDHTVANTDADDGGAPRGRGRRVPRRRACGIGGHM